MGDEKKQQLHISQVRAEDTISVTALMGKKKVELSATYAQLTEEQLEYLNVNYGNHYLPVELITQELNGEEVPITFEGQNSVLHIVVINPDGVFKFDHIVIKRRSFPPEDREIHLINCLAPLGIRYNRRRGVRVNLDTKMEIEQGDEKYAVLVREISYCGFSFINLSLSEIDISRPFVLNLMERDGEKSFSVGKFIGKVHRVVEEAGSSTIYGCVLADKHANYLQRYIAMKQMEAITGKKAFTDIQKNSNSDRWRQEMADALGRTMDGEDEQGPEEENSSS